jgi:hypothetical protein
MKGPSFANDIAPMLFKYRGQMAWRLDLANYDDVKANASIIFGAISYGPGQSPFMPPAPFPPFPQDFVTLFQDWMTDFGP